MYTAYKDKDQKLIQIITVSDESGWAAVLVFEEAELILNSEIHETQVEFHKRIRAEQKRLGIEIDMELSDALE
ncbi:MAG: hypothetical protein WCR42_12270 [bacterium]